MRVLGVDDLEVLHALEVKAQPLPWSDDQLLLELVNEGAVVLGLEEPWEGALHLCGHICLRKMVDELWVLNLAVDPEQRRRGLASELMTRAMAWGRAQGLSSFWLEVRESNEGARALYQSFGMKEVGRRPAYYPPVPPATDRETAILMTTSL